MIEGVEKAVEVLAGALSSFADEVVQAIQRMVERLEDAVSAFTDDPSNYVVPVPKSTTIVLGCGYVEIDYYTRVTG